MRYKLSCCGSFGLVKKLVNKFVLGRCDGLERNFSGNENFSWCENSKPTSFCPRSHWTTPNLHLWLDLVATNWTQKRTKLYEKLQILLCFFQSWHVYIKIMSLFSAKSNAHTKIGRHTVYFSKLFCSKNFHLIDL